VEIYEYPHLILLTVFISASCLNYARALLEYVFFILWFRSISKMLPSVKFQEDKVLTFLILREKC